MILLIVRSERGFVHVPEKIACGVRVNRDADGLGRGWIRGRREGEKRSGCGERILDVVSGHLDLACTELTLPQWESSNGVALEVGVLVVSAPS